MRRGFKTEAEARSIQIRAEMGLKALDPIDPAALAKHVGAEVRMADALTSIERLVQLEEVQPGAFSACTFSLGDRHIIVVNPLSSAPRRASDIAHEVAHILLRHEVKAVEQVGSFSFFTCDPDEEQEANWLAGCLLLPRPLLAAAARKRMTPSAVAEAHGVSEQMASYRFRATGVDRQYKR